MTGIQRILTGIRSQRHLPSKCFFGPIGKTRWPPLPLIGWDIFYFSSERNSTKLDRKQDLNVLYQVCVFWGDRKNKMAALTSDCWDIFVFSSEQNSTKLDRNQDLNALYQVSVFWADQKNRMAELSIKVAHCTQVHDMWQLGLLLTFTFRLLFKNCNISLSFSMRRGLAFIFYMYIPWDKTEF